MNAKHFLRLSIIIAFCLIIVAGKGYSAELNGYPIEMKEQAALDTFLSNHEWEILPVDTRKSGTIDSFAAADRSLCAIATEDKIFVYRDSAIVACYHYYTPGEFRLLFDDATLIIYEVRGADLLFVNMETDKLSLYDLDVEKADFDLQAKFYKFGLNQPVATVDGNGYYVTSNIPGVGEFIGNYEKLVYKQNGQEIILYETYMQTAFLVSNALIVLIAGIIMFFVLRKKQKDRVLSRGNMTRTDLLLKVKPEIDKI